MDALFDLKDLLVKELEAYGKKGEMSASVLERVDMLAHATKNLDKVIECMEEEEEYSVRYKLFLDNNEVRNGYAEILFNDIDELDIDFEFSDDEDRCLYFYPDRIIVDWEEWDDEMTAHKS